MGFCERGSVCDRVMKPGYQVRTWSTGDDDSDLHRAYHNACQSLRLGVKIAADPDCSFKALPGSHFSRTHPPEERLLQWSMPDGDFRLVAFDTLLFAGAQPAVSRVPGNDGEFCGGLWVPPFLEPEHGVVEAFERVHSLRSADAKIVGTMLGDRWEAAVLCGKNTRLKLERPRFSRRHLRGGWQCQDKK